MALTGNQLGHPQETDKTYEGKWPPHLRLLSRSSSSLPPLPDGPVMSWHLYPVPLGQDLQRSGSSWTLSQGKDRSVAQLPILWATGMRLQPCWMRLQPCWNSADISCFRSFRLELCMNNTWEGRWRCGCWAMEIRAGPVISFFPRCQGLNLSPGTPPLPVPHSQALGIRCGTPVHSQPGRLRLKARCSAWSLSSVVLEYQT